MFSRDIVLWKSCLPVFESHWDSVDSPLDLKTPARIKSPNYACKWVRSIFFHLFPIHYCNLERFPGCHLGSCPGHVGPGCIFVTLTALQCDTVFVKEIIQFHCFLTSIFIYFLSFDGLAADQMVLLKVDCILILKLTIRL